MISIIWLLSNIYLSVSPFFWGYSYCNAQTATFTYTGTLQYYTVPACVNSISVDIQGAKGGNRGAMEQEFNVHYPLHRGKS